MAKQVISASHYKDRKVFKKDGENFLNISEFYYDTIQGEGIYTGHPAAFLRLQGCQLACDYCDTKEVYKYGTSWSFPELFKVMPVDMIKKLWHQHLIITGGSPLLQQEKLAYFLQEFEFNYMFRPYIEIENECTIKPIPQLTYRVNCWNNSPKLSNSGVLFERRYKPDVIRFVARLANSWFKFVISDDSDWDEIETGFLQPELIRKEQIILMPLGETRAELERTRPRVVEIAIENNVRYCTREHIILWDKQVGI